MLIVYSMPDVLDSSLREPSIVFSAPNGSTVKESRGSIGVVWGDFIGFLLFFTYMHSIHTREGWKYYDVRSNLGKKGASLCRMQEGDFYVRC